MLTIAIPTYNRPDNLKQVLASLATKLLPPADDINVMVSMDWSPKHTEEIQKICRESGVVDRVITHRPKLGAPLGITRHVQWMLNHALEDSRYVWLLEDDIVPIGNWLNMLHSEMRQETLAFAMHPDLNPSHTLDVDRPYTEQLRINTSTRTSCWGILLHRNMIREIHRFTSFEEYSWDYAMNKAFDLMEERPRCSVVPRVKHIGKQGQHFRGDEPVWKMLDNLYTQAEEIYRKCTTNQPSDTQALQSS